MFKILTQNYDGDVLVASSSIPSYHDTPLNFYDRKVLLNGEYDGELLLIHVIMDFILAIEFIMNHQSKAIPSLLIIKI